MMLKLCLKITNANVKNRIRTVKKNFFTVKDLRSASGFGWDPDLQIVVASDEAWMDYVKSHPDAAQFRGKPIPRYDDLDFIFGNDRATGKASATGNFPPCATTPRWRDTDVSSNHTVDLNDDINIISSEERGDDAPHIHWSDDSPGGDNIPRPSPTQHGNASCNMNSTVNSKKRPRVERPEHQIGTGMVDIGGAMKSIAIFIDRGPNFGQMAQIIPALEELEGLTADEVLRATKLLLEEEALLFRASYGDTCVTDILLSR
ncbi:uncharacterized protein At2g29880-like [Magnolia sinica]|uniref:uncharacterized protein At2g29880-like n=1 Tax=Magnolia sinica TaxID=86752 RepID=UPI00265A7811|nr:uncharacterized protein At2g29880-like [Magnolia sinica]